MSLTLDELLALLPDNTTGAIGADDLRTIVTELFNAAHTVATQSAFQWTGQAAAGAGKLNVDAWSSAAATLAVADQTADGLLFPFLVIDGLQDTCRIQDAARPSTMDATITGPAVDSGAGYHTLPIAVTSVVGGIPQNGDKLTLTMLAVRA